MLPGSKENQEQRISLLVNQWMVFALLFKTPEYYDLLTRYEPLMSKLGSPGLRGAFYARLGACQWWFGFLDEAIQTLTEAAELCEAAGNAEDSVIAYAYLQWSYLVKGDPERVLALNKDILRKTDERIDLRWHVFSLGGTSWAYSVLGRWDEAEKQGQKALAVAEEFSDNSLISLAAGYISNVYTDKGDMNLAVKYGELAATKAPTPADYAMSQFYLARIWCRSGQPRRGIDILHASLPVLRAARLAPMELMSLSNLSVGYRLAGEHEKARQTAEELLQLAERCGAPGIVGLAHAHLGEVALECKLAEAVTHFEKCAEIAQEGKAENSLAGAYSGLGRFYKQQGNVEKAREYLTKALEIFERLGTLIYPDRVRNELAGLGD
jgi:tetratricopeptide (TPR) repeat protein